MYKRRLSLTIAIHNYSPFTHLGLKCIEIVLIKLLCNTSSCVGL